MNISNLITDIKTAVSGKVMRQKLVDIFTSIQTICNGYESQLTGHSNQLTGLTNKANVIETGTAEILVTMGQTTDQSVTVTYTSNFANVPLVFCIEQGVATSTNYQSNTVSVTVINATNKTFKIMLHNSTSLGIGTHTINYMLVGK